MNKNIALFSGVAIFVALFYQQEPGINLSLFTLLIWIFLFATSKKEVHTKEFWCLSAALFVSVGAFAWYGDFISFAALFCSLSAILIKVTKTHLSALLLPIAAFVNYASTPFRILLLDKWLPFGQTESGAFKKKIIAYLLIPAFFLSCFAFIYASGSKAFSSLFAVDFNINYGQLIGLSIVGFLICFSVVHPYISNIIISANGNISHSFNQATLTHKPLFGFADLKIERKSAQITLLLLNILLVVFIIIYNIETFKNIQNNTFPLPEELYGRIYALIFSIVMAITIIMLYFKGALNFDEKNRILKQLSYVWLALNIMLITSIVITNNEYIYASGLTFKRLGIYIFLFLALIGLVVTYLKLKNQKTNFYLVSRMLWATYTTLIVGAIINWSWVVTKYNFNIPASYDLEYTKSLPYNKQLLYDRKLIPETEFAKIIENHSRLNFLSGTIYYYNLKH